MEGIDFGEWKRIHFKSPIPVFGTGRKWIRNSNKRFEIRCNEVQFQWSWNSLKETEKNKIPNPTLLFSKNISLSPPSPHENLHSTTKFSTLSLSLREQAPHVVSKHESHNPLQNYMHIIQICCDNNVISRNRGPQIIINDNEWKTIPSSNNMKKTRLTNVSKLSELLRKITRKSSSRMRTSKNYKTSTFLSFVFDTA